MRVKMRSIMATPKQTAVPGDVIEVSAEQGRDLVAGGYAVPVKEPVTAPSLADVAKKDEEEAKKAAAETERAALEPPENTSAAPVPRRRRSAK